MNELNSYSKKVRTDITSPVFNDGMVVTAGDLTSAMQYPVMLFQSLVRAYFGCGVVCGLNVEQYPQDPNADPDDNKWWLTLHPGTALDCHGYPLKICECQKISLRPDPCSCEDLPEKVCIALRRCVVPEAPRDDADPCDPNADGTDAYRRSREYVEIKIFGSSAKCFKRPSNSMMCSLFVEMRARAASSRTILLGSSIVAKTSSTFPGVHSMA